MRLKSVIFSILFLISLSVFVLVALFVVERNRQQMGRDILNSKAKEAFYQKDMDTYFDIKTQLGPLTPTEYGRLTKEDKKIAQMVAESQGVSRPVEPSIMTWIKDLFQWIQNKAALKMP